MVSVRSLFEAYLESLFEASAPDNLDALRTDIQGVVGCFDDTREILIPASSYDALLSARGWKELKSPSRKEGVVLKRRGVI